MAGLRGGDDLHDRYLWHWLGASKGTLAAKGRGATFLQVNRNDIAEMTIPLPPIEEQRRIAAVLDQADELRTKRVAALDLLDTLTQSIFLDMFGDPVANPKGWDIVPFGDVCPSHLGKMLDNKTQTGQETRQYLRNANVRWFDVDVNDLAEMDFGAADRSKYRLAPGDVLICEGGEPGRAAIWNGSIQECYFQKALHRARPDVTRIRGEFVVHLLWHLAQRGGLSDHISSATIAHLTGVRLKALPIPLPPVEQQDRFKAGIEGLTRLREDIRRSAVELEALFQSLQQRAFRGEL